MARIAITGSTGLVGTDLVAFLGEQRHDVIRIMRGGATGGGVSWDLARGTMDGAGLEGVDGVVHLAGESVANRRWSAAQKQRILESRVVGTRLLCDTLSRLERKPRVLVSASAIGFYGDRGSYECDEQAACGTGFLTDVCVAWEAATETAAQAGIRVVNLRIGVILSRKGGALAKMLLPFQLGVGGVVGSGRQFFSWITLADLIQVIDFCLNEDRMHGPVNAVAPNPVTNYEFTKTLGRVLHRPTVIPMPAFAARMAFGEMADAMFLASARVVPKRLVENGFRFSANNLELGLRQALAR